MFCFNEARALRPGKLQALHGFHQPRHASMRPGRYVRESVFCDVAALSSYNGLQ